jgi:hypothetical protein
LKLESEKQLEMSNISPKPDFAALAASLSVGLLGSGIA